MKVSEEEYKNLIAKGLTTGDATPYLSSSNPVERYGYDHDNPPKYKNIKVWESDDCPVWRDPERKGDVKFDSEGELQRWKDLQIEEKGGLITELVRQKKIELIAKYTFGDIIVSSASVVVDFMYWDKMIGWRAVEQFKGYKDPKYILQRATFLSLLSQKYSYRESFANKPMIIYS